VNSSAKRRTLTGPLKIAASPQPVHVDVGVVPLARSYRDRRFVARSSRPI
jgi:hypothetical protein